MSAAEPQATRRIRVMVADDEPLNRARLEDLLARESGIELVGSAEDGVQAIAQIREVQPDLLFLDVQMPGRTGLEVVREIGVEHMPLTIFVTAWDKYAVTAFDMAAVDYLLKPFDDERFEQAMARARRALSAQQTDRLRDGMIALLQAHGVGAPDASTAASPVTDTRQASGFIERLAVDIRGTVRPVLVRDIDFIEASGPYAELHVGTHRYVIRASMQYLEDHLDPAHFLRVHRSAIVQLDRITSLKRGAGGDGELVLRGGERIKVSRTRREAVERWMGIA